MPSQSAHLIQASHNKNLLEDFDLLHTEFIDWVVTVLFYSAVHYVEAFLAEISIHCTNHPYRERQVSNLLPDIYDSYNDLKNDSIESRYYMRQFSVDEISNEIAPNLEIVKNHILSRISS